MAVSRQRAQESLDGTGEATTLVEPRLELRPFCRRRQLTEPQQARHVLEADGVRQMADRAAMTSSSPAFHAWSMFAPPVRELETSPGTLTYLGLIIVD